MALLLYDFRKKLLNIQMYPMVGWNSVQTKNSLKCYLHNFALAIMRKLFLAACIFFSCAACHNKEKQESKNLFGFRLNSIDQSQYDFAGIKKNKASVFIFLAPDCPLSQNYSLTLNTLADKFKEDTVFFYGIIAGKNFEKKEVEDFVNKFKIKIPVLLDEELNLAAYFDASKTPEVFVANSEGIILYKGAIDDWAIDLGQHRSVITQHYLEDALKNFVSDKEIPVKETKAVGCFIERNL